jgi:hypothetical protein
MKWTKISDNAHRTPYTRRTDWRQTNLWKRFFSKNALKSGICFVAPVFGDVQIGRLSVAQILTVSTSSKTCFDLICYSRRSRNYFSELSTLTEPRTSFANVAFGAYCFRRINLQKLLKMKELLNIEFFEQSCWTLAKNISAATLCNLTNPIKIHSIGSCGLNLTSFIFWNLPIQLFITKPIKLMIQCSFKYLLLKKSSVGNAGNPWVLFLRPRDTSGACQTFFPAHGQTRAAHTACTLLCSDIDYRNKYCICSYLLSLMHSVSNLILVEEINIYVTKEFRLVLNFLIDSNLLITFKCI